MRSLKMGLVSLDQQNNHGIMVDDDDGDEGENNQNSSTLGSNSSFENLSNISSSDSELFGEEEELLGEGDSNSSPNSSSSDGGGGGSLGHHSHTLGGLQNMSTLLQQLPFKRGLSKHYNGKSQSFTSLSNVRSLEDMAKPENPYSKKLKSCKSYGVFSLEQPPHDVIRSTSPPPPPSRLNSSSKRGSCSSLSRSKRSNGSFLGNITSTSKPPVPPHRSTSTTSFTTQTPLFA